MYSFRNNWLGLKGAWIFVVTMSKITGKWKQPKCPIIGLVKWSIVHQNIRIPFIKRYRISRSVENEVIKLCIVHRNNQSAMKLRLLEMFAFFIIHFYNWLNNFMSMYYLRGDDVFFHLGDKGNMIDVMTWRKRTTGTHLGITKSK